MRKWIKIVLWTLLSAAAVIVCVVRWQAWFGMPAEPQWTGDTLVYSFPTFAGDSVCGFVRTDRGWQDTLSPQSLDLLVLGDVHNGLLRSDYDTLAARVPQADVLVQAGDWLERGYTYYYQLLLREYTGSALAGLPVIACPGNHEYSKGLHKQLAPEWPEWFGQQKGLSCVPGMNYYVDFPQLRFIVIDTNPLNRLVYMTRTATWLRGLIQSADGRAVVVMMHHPVLPAGEGRFNPTIYATFRLLLREADVVIAGHDHSYMRSMPYVVLNTAGKTKPQRKRPLSEYVSAEPAYMVLTQADGGDICLRTYRICDGEMIDSVYVKHN